LYIIVSYKTSLITSTKLISRRNESIEIGITHTVLLNEVVEIKHVY